MYERYLYALVLLLCLSLVCVCLLLQDVDTQHPIVSHFFHSSPFIALFSQKCNLIKFFERFSFFFFISFQKSATSKEWVLPLRPTIRFVCRPECKLNSLKMCSGSTKQARNVIPKGPMLSFFLSFRRWTPQWPRSGPECAARFWSETVLGVWLPW